MNFLKSHKVLCFLLALGAMSVGTSRRGLGDEVAATKAPPPAGAKGAERLPLPHFDPVNSEAPGGNAGLFVGVNQFDPASGLSPLRFAVNDAIGQAHLFVLELKLIPAANCYLCLSGEPSTDESKAQLRALQEAGVHTSEATHTKIFLALRTATSFGRALADVLIVSMSSHGFEDRGNAYAMPCDGLRTDLMETGVDLQKIEQKLSSSKAGKRLLILDACREKALLDGSKGAADEPMKTSFRVALEKAQGQAVLASCDAGQLSYESEMLGHGLFTYFLLKGLQGEARADDRGLITLDAISKYLAEKVPAWALKNEPGVTQDEAQKPWFKGTEEARQIPLAIDCGMRDRLAEQARAAAALHDARIKKLMELLVAKKITAEQFAEGSGLLDNGTDHDASPRRRAYEALADGKLPPEYLPPKPPEVEKKPSPGDAVAAKGISAGNDPPKTAAPAVNPPPVVNQPAVSQPVVNPTPGNPTPANPTPVNPPHVADPRPAVVQQPPPMAPGEPAWAGSYKANLNGQTVMLVFTVRKAAWMYQFGDVNCKLYKIGQKDWMTLTSPHDLFPSLKMSPTYSLYIYSGTWRRTGSSSANQVNDFEFTPLHGQPIVFHRG